MSGEFRPRSRSPHQFIPIADSVLMAESLPESEPDGPTPYPDTPRDVRDAHDSMNTVDDSMVSVRSWGSPVPQHVNNFLY